MDKKGLKMFADKITKVIEGGDGFVLLGSKDAKGQLSGGIFGKNVSQADMSTVLCNAIDVSPAKLAMSLMHLDIISTIESRKKVAKKKVAKKTTPKK